MTAIAYKPAIVARKQHQCWWCGQAIERGETYSGWTWVDDGPARVRVHLECEKAWQRIGYEEVGSAEFSRGCLCQNGHCECKQEEKEGSTDASD